jgi:hypothetical protein
MDFESSELINEFRKQDQIKKEKIDKHCTHQIEEYIHGEEFQLLDIESVDRRL